MENSMFELGDIIKIVSPNQLSLHESTFFISYVVPFEVIHLVNIVSFEKHVLPLHMGSFLENIEQIHLLSRSAEKGYARQNRLLPKTWLDIEFGGHVPSRITAQILRLDEDMIALQTFPEKEMLYIDFAYQGIPPTIPIQKMCVRDQPASYTEPVNEPVDGPVEIEETAEEEIFLEQNENGDYVVTIPKNKQVDEAYQDVLSRLLKPPEEEEDDPFVYNVEKESKYHSYKLEVQKLHLLNDFLASVSDENRTHRVLQNIQNHIQRFEQLRATCSVFDEYNQVTGPRQRNPLTHKPLAEALQNMSVRIPWMLPVVAQTKNLYDIKVSEPDANSYDIINVLEDEDKLITLYQQTNYENNTNIKYKEMHTQLARLWAPFGNQWSTENTLLRSLAVTQDVEAVVANKEGFLSTSVWTKDQTHDHPFYVQRYNGQMDYSSKGLHTLMEKDAMCLDSLLILPSTVMNYSRIYLPTANILQRVNLHNNLFYLSTLFNDYRTQNIQPLEIEVVREPQKEQNKMEFFPSFHMKHATFSSISEYIEAKSPEEQFALFLQELIPNIKTTVLHCSKQKKAVSISQFFELLEPYLIYRNDVGWSAMESIQFYVRDNITRHFDRYQKNRVQYNSLVLKNFHVTDWSQSSTYTHIKTSLFMEQAALREAFLQHYERDAKTSSEMVKNVHHVDQGHLLFRYIQLASIELVSPIELLEQSMEIDDDIVPVTRKSCYRKVLAKRYASLNALTNDNAKPDLEYDKEFDDIQYAVLKAYATEKKAMEPEIFLDFLKDKLIEKHNCPRSLSEEMAITLVRGKRYVQEGEYAVLELRPEYRDDPSELTDKEKKKLEMEADVRKKTNYYRRKKNSWVYDKDVDDTAFIDSNVLFCNIEKSCYKKDSASSCESVTDLAPRLKRKTRQEIMAEFSVRYAEDIEERKKEMMIAAQKAEVLIEKIHQCHLYNQIRTDMHCFAMSTGISPFIEVIVSPYQALHDSLMSPSFDFVRKQEMIVEMVTGFCREPLPTENQHWKYCKTTNTPLMEDSLYRLAIAYKLNKYNQVMDQLCRTNGVDEGEFTRDKYTGCILKSIEMKSQYQAPRDEEDDFNDYEFEEEETEHEDLEWDDSGAVTAEFRKQTTINSEMRIFHHLMKTICRSGEGIDVDVEMIQDTVFDLLNTFTKIEKFFMGEKIYIMAREKEAKKTNPPQTYPPYEEYVKVKQMDVLTAAIILAIQSLIPPMRRRKTFMGCTQSFDGFPMSDDLSTIDYLSCVLRAIAKNSEESRWKAVSPKPSVMEKRIKFVLDAVIKLPQVSLLLEKKRAYLELHKEDEIIPTHLDVAKNWHRFSPIIVPFKVIPLQNVSESMKEEWMATMKQGKKEQWIHMGTVMTKLDLFAAGVLEHIQKHVKKHLPLLNSQSKIPFLQNACCNESIQSPLLYFMAEEENIVTFVNHVNKNALILRDVQELVKAPMLVEQSTETVSLLPTKQVHVFSTYSKTDLYKAFIHHCQLDHPLNPIPTQLKFICSEKPEKYDSKASIEEKIDILENNGLRMSLPKIILMMNTLSSAVSLSDGEEPRYKDLLAQIEQLKTSNVFSAPFLNVFQGIFETKKFESLQNMMEAEIPVMLRKLEGFLGKNRTKELKPKALQIIFTKLFDTEKFHHITYCAFMKEYMYSICHLVPSYILRSEKYSWKIPSHWNLTPSDSMDMLAKLKELHGNMAKFYLEPKLVAAMEALQKAMQPVSKLLQNYTLLFPRDKTALTMTFFKYVFLVVVLYHFELSIDPIVLRQTLKIARDDQDGQIDDLHIEIQNHMLQLFSFYFHALLPKYHKYSTMTYSEIMKRIEHSREKEKKTIKDYLGSMHKEVRRVELEMKLNHLGKFNVNTKKLITYGNQEDLFGAVMNDDEVYERLEQMAMDDAQVEDVEEMEEMEEGGE